MPSANPATAPRSAPKCLFCGNVIPERTVAWTRKNFNRDPAFCSKFCRYDHEDGKKPPSQPSDQ